VKRALILVVVFVASATVASAQQGTSVGVKAGANFTSATTEDPLVETSYSPGFTGGLFLSVPAGDRIAFQPEFLYAYKRTTFTFEGIDAMFSAHYLELPLLLDVRVNSGPSRVSLLVGPSLSIRGRARVEVLDVSSDASDQIDRVDFGLVTGVAVTAGRFVVDGRFTWGLVDVSKGPDDDTSRTRSFTVSAGWRFR
jgi:hypothetical protein